MSLILDALRKSEAERRRGQAPDLFAPVATRTPPAAKPSVVILLIASSLVFATAVIFFWPWQKSPVVATASNVPSESSATSESVAATPTPSNSEVEVTTYQAIAPVVSPSKPIAAKPAAPTAPVEPAPVERSPAPAQPATPDETAAAMPAATIVPSTSDTSATEAEETLPTLATLDSATRTALPPLQLSMHVWNEDPTRRFAIIDGQRLGEGSRLGGVVVAAIRHDGVVLDVDGRQFLLPRP